MTEFTPIAPPYSIYTKDGERQHVLGWSSPMEGVYDPVIYNKENGRASRWSAVHGNDPWYPDDTHVGL